MQQIVGYGVIEPDGSFMTARVPANTPVAITAPSTARAAALPTTPTGSRCVPVKPAPVTVAIHRGVARR